MDPDAVRVELQALGELGRLGHAPQLAERREQAGARRVRESVAAPQIGVVINHRPSLAQDHWPIAGLSHNLVDKLLPPGQGFVEGIGVHGPC